MVKISTVIFPKNGSEPVVTVRSNFYAKLLMYANTLIKDPNTRPAGNLLKEGLELWLKEGCREFAMYSSRTLTLVIQVHRSQ